MAVSSVCSSPLLQAICVGPENLQVMYPAIFAQLLLFVEFSCKPPQYGRMETKHVANAKYNQVGAWQPDLVLCSSAITMSSASLNAVHPSPVAPQCRPLFGDLDEVPGAPLGLGSIIFPLSCSTSRTSPGP